MEIIQCNKIIVIIDKISIVSLDFLATIDLHLGKAKM